MALDDFSFGDDDTSPSNESDEIEAKRLKEEFEGYEDIVDLVEGTFLRWSDGQSMAPVMYDKENNTITALKDHLVVGVAAMIIRFNEEYDKASDVDESDDDSGSSGIDLSDLDDR